MVHAGASGIDFIVDGTPKSMYEKIDSSGTSPTTSAVMEKSSDHRLELVAEAHVCRAVNNPFSSEDNLLVYCPVALRPNARSRHTSLPRARLCRPSYLM